MRWCIPVPIRFTTGLLLALATATPAAEMVKHEGLGSYAVGLPPGAKGPPEVIFVTENAKGPMPTNDWWSSLAWLPFSERHYPHPLAVNAEPAGLRVYYPGPNITANRDAVFAFMPAPSGNDLMLGHSAVARFPDARVDGWSDWFVSVRFAHEGKSLRVSYGHGSPFVYALYEKGNARITFPSVPKVWHGGAKGGVLGITVNGAHYGLFGSSHSSWTGLETMVWENTSSESYFSLAVLPNNHEETLELFRKHAYAHVTNTTVRWQYEPETSQAKTTLTYETKAYEGTERGTLFALYPHQWRHTASPLLELEYASVRGKMKLGQGTEFTTRHVFPGVLPVLPAAEGLNRKQLAKMLELEAAAPMPPVRDTYAEGKWLGRAVTLAEIASANGLEKTSAELYARVQQRLESWLVAEAANHKMKTEGLFAYEPRWGTLIGYPASFGSDTELNDHHFHYGYFLRAAAGLALQRRGWAERERWGGMVELLARDLAAPDRHDRLFPFLRNFDVYAGHSWASGHARFGDGNNHESSSEAMNAWCALVLWGEATGNKELRDLGIYLFATELSAIEEYWFDVTGENRPREFTPSVATMIWGGKAANGTWFSAEPEVVHGINWLPMHGGSLYLGRSPQYAARNYDALVKETGSTRWRQWADILWMYRGLTHPADALAQFEAAPENTPREAGNSPANTYHWLKALEEFGQVDARVTANTPLYAVFQKNGVRTYVAYHVGTSPRATITFSDGTKLNATSPGLVRMRGQ